MPADGGATTPLGAPFETEGGVVATCGTGGASLLRAFERDSACFTTLTWLPGAGGAPWEVEVASCNWRVFPERDAIRLISEDGANRVQRVVTRDGAGAESPLPGLSGPLIGGTAKRCGSSYFVTARTPDALTETLLRFTPGADAGFTPIAERTFDAAVSTEEIACDDRTVLLVVNQGGLRTVLELTGSELVPWSTRPGSTLGDYVAVHSGALWFRAYDAESQMSFITLDAHGTRTLATPLPRTYSKWIHSQSLSAGENLVVLWRTPEGDAWVSVW